MSSSSWLLTGAAEDGKSPAHKRGRHEEEAQGGEGGGVAGTRLLRQLEARVRQLEFAQTDNYFLPIDHSIAVTLKTVAVKYSQIVKEEGAQHQQGSPHLHAFGALLNELHSFCEQATSPEIVYYKAAPSFLRRLLETGGKEMSERWVKACGCSPTFDKKTIRLTVGVEGRLVFGQTGEISETSSPLEMPLPVPKTGKIVDVMAVLFVILRAAGAQVKLGRAPRGPLARGLRT